MQNVGILDIYFVFSCVRLTEFSASVKRCHLRWVPAGSWRYLSDRSSVSM